MGGPPPNLVLLVGALSAGGAQRVAVLLANHWVSQGHRVALICTYSGRGSNIFHLDERIDLYFLADLAYREPKIWPGKVRRAMALRHLVAQWPGARVIAFLTHVNVLAIGALGGLPNALVVSERIYPPKMPTPISLQWLRRWSYPRATAVVMQTEAGRLWLSQEIPTAKSEVIANPVVVPVPDGFPAIQPDEVIDIEAKVILGAGRLDKQKGFDQLITAFATLASRHPDWRLVIAGEGQERAALEAQVRQLGLESQIHLPGEIGNIGYWYDRAEIFALSSRFEGFPNALLEAMAYGLACISFNCETGPVELITQNRNGVLVEPEGSTKQLCAALHDLILNPEKRARLGQAARVRSSEFGVEKIAAQWLGVGSKH